MFRYSRYLAFTFSKKWSPYIVTAVFIALYAVMSYFMITSGNDSGVSAIENVSTFDKFFPFLFGALFASFVVVHVFKDGEADGTELTIISKPLTRSQIIFSKFLVVLGMLFIFQLFMFFVYLGVSMIDTQVEFSSQVAYAGSFAVGGLIVQIIITSVIILIASFMGRTGTIVIGILASAAFPILSFSITPLTNGQPFNLTGFENKRYSLSVDENGEFVKNTDQIYFGTEEQLTNIDADGNGVISAAEAEADSRGYWTSVVNYEDSQTYAGISYIDVWYQWGRFYDLFNPSTGASSAIAQRWSQQEVTMNVEDKDLIQIGDVKYMIMLPENDYANNLKITLDKSAIDTLLNANQATFSSWTSSTSFTNRMAFISGLFNNPQINQINNLVLYKSAVDRFAIDTPTDQTIEPLYSGFLYKASEFDGTNWNDVKYITLVNTPWIDTSTVIIIWVVVGLALVAAATFVYYRRDFK